MRLTALPALLIGLCLLLLQTDLTAASSAPADPTTPKVTAPTRPCIGLVLGGGGARGAAHIGVLQVLERERVPICRITGTSMGAIVGGMYAAGYSPEEIGDILASVDWKDVLNDDPSRQSFPMRRKNDTLRYLMDFRFGLRNGALQLPRGAIQGQKLLLLLRRLTLHTWRTPHFDQLPIPFRAVATDIVSGQAKVFEQGDLALAIRSSMSVPGAFAPIRVDGRLLVDGGIVNNVPVDVAQQIGAERLIVVDVGAPLMADEQLNSPIAISVQMLDILMKQRTQSILAAMDPRDIKVLPDLGDIGSASFDRAVEAIPTGVAAAEAVLPKLREYAIDEASWQQWQAQHRRREMDPLVVEFLDVLRNRSRTAGYVARELEGFEGRPLDLARLEAAIGHTYGQGNYERIAWEPVQREGQVGIQVTPVDKGWGPNYLNFGLQLSDDFQGRNSYQLGIEYTQTGLNPYGGEWRTRAEIGANTGLRTEFYQPAGDRGQFFAFPYLETRAFDQTLRDNTHGSAATLSSYRVRRSTAGLDIGYEIDTGNRLFIGLSRGHGSARVEIGDNGELPSFSANLGAFRLGYVHDTLDDADFPGSGRRGEVLLNAERPELGGSSQGETLDLIWDQTLRRDRHHLLIGARLHGSWGDPGVFDALAPLGGFLNLSGYAERELLGRQSLLLRGVYYRRLGDAGQLFSVPAFVGGSIETGNVYERREDLLALRNLIWSGSVFVGIDSPFGPIFLGYGRASSGEDSLYLNFGTLLRPRL
jgi:NTE family protein